VIGEDGVERRQRLARRSRPQRKRHRQRHDEPAHHRMAGTAGVPYRRLPRSGPVLEALAHVGDPGERVPDVDEALVVVRGVEQKQRPAGEPLQLFGRAPAVEHSRQRGGRARERRAGLVSGCGRALGGRVGHRDRSRDVGRVGAARPTARACATSAQAGTCSRPPEGEGDDQRVLHFSPP
jgi:hypothetical protein